MQKNKTNKSTNQTSQDKMREKVDGFSLNSTKSEKSNKTTDQGTYYPPDDKV
jgi:hypothetical protein